MSSEASRDFRLQLQQARENALKDAEAFDGIIHVVERLGSFCFGRVKSLGAYQRALEKLAKLSALATEVPDEWRNVHTPFNSLYAMVKDARNDAMHQGSFARHLTTHAIELALVLEDALKMSENAQKESDSMISDYMVRDLVCAYLWQPVSLVRQQMLTNSFSYLPVRDKEARWCLVSDLQVAKYLQGQPSNERNQRLATTLEEAVETGEIELLQTKRLKDGTPIAEALKDFDGKPILVYRGASEAELVGILTAFDLL
jgi:CBS domain-containing protein